MKYRFLISTQDKSVQMFYDILKNAKNDLGNLEASFSVTNKNF